MTIEKCREIIKSTQDENLKEKCYQYIDIKERYRQGKGDPIFGLIELDKLEGEILKLNKKEIK